MTPTLAIRPSRRTRRHVTLAVASVMLLAGVHAVVDPMFAWSMATAYASLVLLVWALVVGPWRVLQGRAPSVNSGLRRDFAIWGGVLGVLHVVVGIQVHFRGKPWLYFMPPPDQRDVIPFRADLFGFANYTGLVATVVLVGLLALSNDWSLRRLGATRWKRWQRFNYIGMRSSSYTGAPIRSSRLDRRASWCRCSC